MNEIEYEWCEVCGCEYPVDGIEWKIDSDGRSLYYYSVCVNHV